MTQDQTDIPLNIFGPNPETEADRIIPNIYNPPLDVVDLDSQPNPVVQKLFQDKLGPAANGSKLDQAALIDLDVTSRTRDHQVQIRNLLTDPTVPPESTAQMALELVQNPPQTRTLGEMYSDKVPGVGPALDAAVTKSEDESAFKTMLGRGDESISDIMNEKAPEYTDVMIDIVSLTDDQKAAMFDELRSRTNKDKTLGYFEKAKRQISTNIIESASKGETAPWNLIGDVYSGALSPMVDKVKGEALDLIGLREDASLKQVLAAVSMVPIDKKAEVDLKNMAKIVFSTENLAERADRLVEWDAQFTKRYGKGAYLQLAAFLAKEGVIEGVPLALALRSPATASKLIASNGAKIMTRIGYALRRAAFIGVTGGVNQAAINTYIGEDADLLFETTTRAAGGAAGEALGFAIRGAIRRIKGKPSINESASVLEKTVEAAATSDEALIKSEVNKVGGVISNDIKAANATGQLPTSPLVNGEGLDIQIQMSPYYEATELGQEIIQRGIGPKVIGEAVSRQKNVDDIFEYYIDEGTETVLYGADSYNVKVNPLNILSDPSTFIGKPATDQLVALNLEGKYAAMFKEAGVAAVKGLNKKSVNKVWAAIEYFDDLANKGLVNDIGDVGLDHLGLTIQEEDAFWAIRKTLDTAAVVADRLMVQQARASGLKMFRGEIVEVLGVDGNKAAIRYLRPKGGVSETTTSVGNLKEVTKTIPYRPMYMPRRLDDPQFLVGTIGRDGYKVHYAADSREEARQAVAQIESELAESGADRHVLMIRAGGDSGRSYFGMRNQGLSLLDELSPEQIDSIRATLLASGRTETEVAQLMTTFDHATHGGIVDKAITGKRGKNKLQRPDGSTALYKPSAEAYVDYLQGVAGLHGKNFRRMAIDNFKKEFADVLDPSQPWTQEIKLGASIAVDHADRVAKARVAQSWLQNVVDGKTSIERKYTAAMDVWLARLEDSNSVFAQGLKKVIFKNPAIEEMARDSRNLTLLGRKSTSFALFALNTTSWLAQVAPSIAMNVGARVFTNPTAVAGGLYDLMRAATAKGSVRGVPSSESQRLLRAIRRSGWASEASMNDMADMLSGRGPSIARDTMFFTYHGEKVNRHLGFFIARRELIQSLKEGTLQGLDGKAFKGRVDDTEFLQLVVKRATDFSLNTTTAGQLQLMRGPGAVLFQFYAPLVKTGRALFSPNSGLKPMERVGAGLGLVSMGGFGAIPLASDTMGFADWIVFKAGSEDEIDEYKSVSRMVKSLGKDGAQFVADTLELTKEQKKIIDHFISGGLPEALSDGEITLAGKLYLSSMMSEMVSGFTEDPAARIPFTSVVDRATEASSNIFDAFGNLYDAYVAYDLGGSMDLSQADIHPSHATGVALGGFMGDVMRESSKVFPGFGRINDVLNSIPEVRATLNPNLEGRDPGGRITRSRGMMDEEVTPGRALISMTGLMDANTYHNLRVDFGSEKEWVKGLDQILATYRERYRNASNDAARYRIKKEALEQAQAAEQLLYATHEGALLRHTKQSENTKRYKRGTLARSWNGLLDYELRRQYTLPKQLSTGE